MLSNRFISTRASSRALYYKVHTSLKIQKRLESCSQRSDEQTEFFISSEGKMLRVPRTTTSAISVSSNVWASDVEQATKSVFQLASIFRPNKVFAGCSPLYLFAKKH